MLRMGTCALIIFIIAHLRSPGAASSTTSRIQKIVVAAWVWRIYAAAHQKLYAASLRATRRASPPGVNRMRDGSRAASWRALKQHQHSGHLSNWRSAG